MTGFPLPALARTSSTHRRNDRGRRRTSGDVRAARLCPPPPRQAARGQRATPSNTRAPRSSAGRRMTGPPQGFFSGLCRPPGLPRRTRRSGGDPRHLGQGRVRRVRHPLDPGTAHRADESVEPLVLLSCLAACTERVRLGVSVLVLPVRSPLHLAKQLASLDVLSRAPSNLRACSG